MPAYPAKVFFLAALSLRAAPLGVATSSGEFLMNGVTVRGTATLAEGTVLETRTTASRIALSDGARFLLSPSSRAKLLAGRVLLEQGAVEFDSPSAVEAIGMRVTSGPSSKAIVRLNGASAIQVGALAGNMQVRNSLGLLVANMAAGDALEFEPQVTGPALPSTFVGCLLRKDGKIVIYDQTTRMIVEMRSQGVDLGAEVGNRVQASGTARPGPNNSQALDVTTVTRIEVGGCAEVAATIQADVPGRSATTATREAATKGGKKAAPKPTSTPRPSGQKAGMSAGTKVAILVAVAGGGAGAAIAATQSGKGDSRSR